MFFGRYDYTIDAKGRLNFPAKFRDAMGESFVVLEWVDNCLSAAAARGGKAGGKAGGRRADGQLGGVR